MSNYEYQNILPSNYISCVQAARVNFVAHNTISIYSSTPTDQSIALFEQKFFLLHRYIDIDNIVNQRLKPKQDHINDQTKNKIDDTNCIILKLQKQRERGKSR